MTTLAERLRWVLAHRDLTAHALSVKAGLAGGHVGLLISGRAGKRPAAQTISALAAVAGVSQRWLETGEGSPDALQDSSNAVNDPPGPPQFGGVTNYAALLATARILAPEVPDYAWDALGRAHPLLTQTPSPAMLVDLARVIMKYEPPPAANDTPGPAKKGSRKR